MNENVTLNFDPFLSFLSIFIKNIRISILMLDRITIGKSNIKM
jgi:hypothetical protein